MKQKPDGGGGGADFQDVGSQFWDLDFTKWASHDQEARDFTVSKGHKHPLVIINE